MKTKIIEKNGFLKPLGMFLIIIILSLTCFISLAFADDVTIVNQDELTEKVTEDITGPLPMDGRTSSFSRIGM